jgi:predicted ATPase
MLHLLGTPQWRTATGSHPLPNTLPGWTIAFLALQAGWVARDRLTALFWPDVASVEALHNLRMALHRVRPLLAEWGVEAALEAERRRVRLVLPTDVAALRQTASDASRPAREYSGVLMSSMDFSGFPALEEWAALERAALASTWRESLLERLARISATEPQAVALAQQLLAADALDETALLQLLRALRAQDRPHEADRHYAQYRERLQRELGVEPSPALRAWASARVSGPSPAGAASPDGQAFVGRRLELARLVRQLADAPPLARLITVVGPGGVGKSRLARQAVSQGPLPATWIDLQDLDALDTVISRIAQRLGIDLRDGADAATQIAKATSGVPRLLVLDNAEHLQELPPFTASLLAAAPTLRVLVTSRRPLAVDGETLLPLEGLARPDEDSRDFEAASAFDAVRLFAVRAHGARADFALERHLEAVLAIVDAVGGLPLAIELAASWTRLMPPEIIARELRETIDVLDRDPAMPGEPARPEHASLRAVLERSWALLASRERDALESLAVFEGGFTPTAAAAVAGVALPLLSSLADKGLLGIDDDGRFAMHPLVAVDAARRLGDHAERAAEFRDRHAAYWAATLADKLAQSTADPRIIVAATNADYANACAAWRHAVATRRHEDVLRLTAVWRVVFDTQGRYGEGARLLSTALEIAPAEAASQRAAAIVRGALSMLLFRRQNLEPALAVAEAGIALAELCGERRALVSCLLNAGSVHSILGRWQRARPLYERAYSIGREDHERPEIAVALMNLGICAKKDGRPDEALDFYRRSLAIERELGRHAAAVRCLNNIGVIHMERGEWPATRDHMAEGLRLCQQYGIAALSPYLETGLGQALFELGQFDDARRHLAHVLDTVPAAELPVVHMNVTINLGRVALRQHRLDEARPHFIAAARLALASETEADQLDFAMYWGEWLRDCGRRHDAACTWLSVIAHPMTEAGVRQGCEEGLATLALTSHERAAACAALPTLETLKAQWAALSETDDSAS